jgi:hypothetical protein
MRACLPAKAGPFQETRLGNQEKGDPPGKNCEKAGAKDYVIVNNTRFLPFDNIFCRFIL